VSDSSAVVDVDNASGATGLAARLAQDLTGRGYTTGTVANVVSRHTTVVDYAAGHRAEAQQLAQFLGTGVLAVSDSSLRSGHVRIYLGTDYAGPDSQSVTTPTAPSSAAPPVITAGGQTCVD
jgi:hypothetical protein